MDKLRFGTAGIPFAAEPRNTGNGIATVRTLGLDSMELEFVHSVNIKEENTPPVKEMAEKNDVALSCHAPYYINLNAVEKEKLEASKHRLFKAAKISSLCGASTVAFHPGFYLKQEPEKVYTKITAAVKEIVKNLRDEGIPIQVSPETTGKGTQFGSLDELLKMSQELEGVTPCIDFAHLHARSNGKYNTYDEFVEVLTKVEKSLGREALDNMHIQVAGIEYTEKGERRHLAFKDSDFNYKEMLRAWKEFKIKGIVIAESPAMESDALMLQTEFAKL